MRIVQVPPRPRKAAADMRSEPQRRKAEEREKGKKEREGRRRACKREERGWEEREDGAVRKARVGRWERRLEEVGGWGGGKE